LVENAWTPVGRGATGPRGCTFVRGAPPYVDEGSWIQEAAERFAPPVGLLGLSGALHPKKIIQVT
jgi:hypothetical protein